jgi:hypothetical protein
VSVSLGSFLVVDGACSELECGCLDFGCNCVRVEHEAIGEGGVPYGSDFLPSIDSDLVRLLFIL